MIDNDLQKPKTASVGSTSGLNSLESQPLQGQRPASKNQTNTTMLTATQVNSKFVLDVNMASEFLSIFGDEKVAIRHIHDYKKNKKGSALVVKDIEFQTIKELNPNQNEGWGRFFVVNQLEGDEANDDNITAIRALFIDIDDGEYPTEEELSKVPQPSAIVKTPGGYHFYWALNPGMPVKHFRRYQEALINHFKSDTSIKNESRVMRLPGSWHFKNGAAKVELVSVNSDNRYAYTKFKNLLGNTPKDPDSEVPTTPKVAIEWFRNLESGTRNAGAFRIGSAVPKMKAANPDLDVEDYKLQLEKIWTLELGKEAQEFRDAFERGFEKGAKDLESKPKQLQGRDLFKAQDESLRSYFSGRLRFNVRSGFSELDGGDVDDGQLFREYNLNGDVYIGDRAKFKTLLYSYALDNSYDPFKEYLEGLEPKQPEILTELASRVFDIQNDDEAFLSNLYLWKTLVAAVARAFNPGCKVDTVLILQGAQGARKSTFWEALAGRDLYVSHSAKNLSADKDALMKIHSGAIVDLSEIDLMFSSTDIESIKDFTSTPVDIFRKPYDTLPRKYPRKFIFTGTTNRSEFLSDPTGDRRFWIIPIDKDKYNPIDLEFVRINRDQLWAEAVWMYQQGESWWLDTTEEELHDKRNKQFRVSDPWEEFFTQALPILSGAGYDPSSGISPAAFTLGQLTEGLLGVPKNNEKRSITNRLKDLLTANSFVQTKKGKNRSRVYVPKHLANELPWRVANQNDVIALAQLCGHNHIEPARDDEFGESMHTYTPV